MAQSLAEYKIRYDLDLQEKLRQKNKDEPRRLKYYQFDWQYAQAQALEKHYADLFPGHLVKETARSGDLKVGVYRLQKPALIDEIQKRELPFRVQPEAEY